MQLVKLFASLLLLLAVVHCDYWYNEGNSIQYSYLPTTSLGNFEGSYTSTAGVGFGTFICQDDDFIYGSYDQLGIFHGNVTEDEVSGTWYEAGTGSCVTGNFQIKLTSDGFDGYYTCESSNTRFNWTETKLSPFRPTDYACAIQDLGSPLTIEGRFIGNDNQPKDFCFDEDVATGSYLYTTENGDVEKAYFEGVSHKGGRIAVGTWYSLTPLAGAALYYIDNAGVVQAYYWTGLEGTEGNTVINPAQYRQEEYHYLESYTGPISRTTSENCDDYSTIKTKVLNNLVADYDDNDQYYFVTSDFNDDDGEVILSSSSDATLVCWSAFVLFVALFI